MSINPNVGGGGTWPTDATHAAGKSGKPAPTPTPSASPPGAAAGHSAPSNLDHPLKNPAMAKLQEFQIKRGFVPPTKAAAAAAPAAGAAPAAAAAAPPSTQDRQNITAALYVANHELSKAKKDLAAAQSEVKKSVASDNAHAGDSGAHMTHRMTVLIPTANNAQARVDELTAKVNDLTAKKRDLKGEAPAAKPTTGKAQQFVQHPADEAQDQALRDTLPMKAGSQVVSTKGHKHLGKAEVTGQARIDNATAHVANKWIKASDNWEGDPTKEVAPELPWENPDGFKTEVLKRLGLPNNAENRSRINVPQEPPEIFET